MAVSQMTDTVSTIDCCRQSRPCAGLNKAEVPRAEVFIAAVQSLEGHHSPGGSEKSCSPVKLVVGQDAPPDASHL